MRVASLLPALLSLCGAMALAADMDPVSELSQRSGLPASEVSALLAHCDANQTSMNVCAWRDQLVAEQALRQAVEQAGGASPGCRKALEARMAAWAKRRDTSCQRSADRRWSDGSLRPAATALCAAQATKHMTAAVRKKACR